MSDKKKITVDSSGPIWLVGWLFTLGYLKLTFWKAIFAILVWPYFLGSALADKVS